MASRLEGVTAIISGSGRGIGRASAIAMAKEGARVIIMSRTQAELEETARVIRRSGGEVVSVVADVSVEKDVKRVVEAALNSFGSIGIVMNNAGIIGAAKPLYSLSTKEWDEAMDINLKGAFMLTREAAGHMIKTGRGKIINVTSGLAETVMSPFGAYSVSKAGLNHFTRILAEELRPFGIQVNALDPGMADTRMHEEIRALGPRVLGEELYGEFVSFKQKGYLSPPEEAARLAVFLASSDSDHITGQLGGASHYRRFGYRG